MGAGLSLLTDQLTLSQPRGTDYAHHSTTSTPGFSDLATGLSYKLRAGFELNAFFFPQFSALTEINAFFDF